MKLKILFSKTVLSMDFVHHFRLERRQWTETTEYFITKRFPKKLLQKLWRRIEQDFNELFAKYFTNFNYSDI